MTEPRYIERNVPDPEGLDFESLKDEAIGILQALCGKTWTDYNLHDPGVTILEQLCYALTDLIYRTEFETADYLTDETGNINFKHQALYRPHHIFPSQPITLNDYRKTIFDSVTELDNVWVKTVQEAQPQGLYRIYALPRDTPQAPDHDATKQKIGRIYAANRNLCEDLDDVVIVEPRSYHLHGTVQIDSRRDAAEMLAEIYFKCSAHITPSIRFSSYEEMRNKGKSLEEIFTGPLTTHVYIEADGLGADHGVVNIADLVNIIGDIEGIREIEYLWLEDETGTRSEEGITYDVSDIPRLQFPSRECEMGITLRKNDRVYDIDLRDLRVAFDQFNSVYQALRHTTQNFTEIDNLPKGEFRHFDNYYSIQNHFPDVYGINAYGIPASETPRRKAQAKQLKAYLLFFEQLLANFLANTKESARLFSLDRDLKQTYFHQRLHHPNVPNIDKDKLYKGESGQLDIELAHIVSRYDPFGDRRNRVLDYMLELYGEKFTQNSLRRFHYYGTAQELAHDLIQNKINLLKDIVNLSQKRAGAFNYQEGSWNTDNVSSLQKKVSILLGLPHTQTRSLSDVFVEHGLELISDDRFERLREGTVELPFVDLSDIDAHIQQQFQAISPETPARDDERMLFNEIIFLKNNVISESILRNGIYPDRYRVGSAGEGQNFQLVFRADDNSPWLYLASYNTAEEAARAANDLRRLLVRLNMESEGFHIVEHILLRPVTRQEESGSHLPADFHSFKMSLIFPAWTARFNHREFQKLAEETVQLNCPAHIDPAFYWLDLGTMRTFEDLYKTWVETKRNREAEAETLNTAARQLIAFLLGTRH